MRGILAAILLLGSGCFVSPALSEFEAPGPVPGAGKDGLDSKFWDITVRLYGGHNDNVDFVSDGDPFFMGSTDSDYIGMTARGSIRVPVNAFLTVGGSLTLERVWNFGTQRVPMPAANEDQNAYDVRSAQPSVFIETPLILGGRTGALGVSYDLRFEDAEITAVGARTHRLTAYSSLNWDPYTEFGANVSRAWTDFEVAFPAPMLDNRDATHTAVSLSATRWFPGFQRSLTGAVTFNRNQAEGKNFDHHGVKIAGTFKSRIYGPVSAAANVSYDMQHYPGFVSGFVTAPGRESQSTLTTGVQVFWVICPGWTLDGFFTYSKYDSNLPIFEGDNKNVGMGLTRKF